MKKIPFILFFLVSTIFGQDKECPGYVFEREVDGVTFTGQCGEEGPIWGVTNYGDGEAFQGYYSDGRNLCGALKSPHTILLLSLCLSR